MNARRDKEKIIIWVCVVQLLISVLLILFNNLLAVGWVSTIRLIFLFPAHSLFELTIFTAGLVGFLLVTTFVPILILRYNKLRYWIYGGLLAIVLRIVYIICEIPHIPAAPPFYFRVSMDVLPYYCFYEVCFTAFIVFIECIFCLISKRFWSARMKRRIFNEGLHNSHWIY